MLGEAGGKLNWRDTTQCLFPCDTNVPGASNYSGLECACWLIHCPLNCPVKTVDKSQSQRPLLVSCDMTPCVRIVEHQVELWIGDKCSITGWSSRNSEQSWRDRRCVCSTLDACVAPYGVLERPKIRRGVDLVGYEPREG